MWGARPGAEWWIVRWCEAEPGFERRSSALACRTPTVAARTGAGEDDASCVEALSWECPRRLDPPTLPIVDVVAATPPTSAATAATLATEATDAALADNHDSIRSGRLQTNDHSASGPRPA